MKEFVCFAIGMAIGIVLMKKSQLIDQLEGELERERLYKKTTGGGGSA